MPKLDELAGQCLPDGAGPKHTNPHAATLASGCAPAHTFVTKRRDLWHFHRPTRSDSPTTLAEVLDLEAQAQSRASRTRDYVEGFTAFIERREPTFVGE